MDLLWMPLNSNPSSQKNPSFLDHLKWNKSWCSNSGANAFKTGEIKARQRMR